jgi:23S rRNA (cytosine1962-C5)-methyltransferase
MEYNICPEAVQEDAMKQVVVKPHAVKKIRNYYLWVYADEIRERPRQSYPGEVVAVVAPDGAPLGAAFHHPDARIALRLFHPQPVLPDAGFWRRKLEAAVARRRPLRAETDALRLIYAEGDYLPGLIVDDFAGHLVLQSRCAGIEAIKPLLVGLLADLCAPASIYERSDVPARAEEGLADACGQVRGETPERVEVRENGRRFAVDIRTGTKTGYFTDQRDARRHVAGLVSPGMRVLDAFCYTGGFGIYAATAGARVTAVDKDEAALAGARENAALNGVTDRFETVAADLFRWLPEQAAAGASFDLICLDPPALIKYKNQAAKGRGLFLDLIRPCLRMLRPGGHLHVSSCAYHMGGDLLREAVRFAAADTGTRLLTVGETIQAPDHPYSLQMPETLYLKGYTLEVVGE